MEDLTEVITAAEFHPLQCNTFVYSSSKGTIRLCDMRNAALCDKHSKRQYFFFPPCSHLNRRRKDSIVSASLQCLRSQKIPAIAPSSQRSSLPSLMSSSATTVDTWWPETTCLWRSGTSTWRPGQLRPIRWEKKDTGVFLSLCCWMRVCVYSKKCGVRVKFIWGFDFYEVTTAQQSSSGQGPMEGAESLTTDSTYYWASACSTVAPTVSMLSITTPTILCFISSNTGQFHRQHSLSITSL